MTHLISKFGAATIAFIEATGHACFLLQEIVQTLFTYPLRCRQLLRQVLFCGIRSQGVVLITGGFTGAVFTAQTLFQFRELGMASATGPVVAVAMCRELGPVLCALMVAGRVGSAIAAELSTMKLTEQLDALRALAVYPTQYLIVPRFLALVLSMPLLVGLAMAIGILASWIVAVPVMEVDPTYYMHNMIKFTLVKNIWIGLTKALFFGMIIALVSIHKGLTAGHGAEGVGQATTQAAVHSSILVLVSNFFFSFLLNALFHSKT
ncbi:MAG: ABC transporter permease [Verrucomicrobium sp.]|nr:ABC transporter permease [Verrucomicrobium sp.]